MTLTSTIKATATAPSGKMTLGELSAFVRACYEAETALDATLTVTLKGFSGRLHSIETAPPAS